MVAVDYNAVMSTMSKAIRELNEKKDVNKHAYLQQPFKHFENLKPMPAPPAEEHIGEIREIKIENIPDEKVQIPKDNLIVIDEISGEAIPPITKYDYSDPYTFREKDKT